MITLDIRRWDVRHLAGASLAYWSGLAAVTFAPFVRTVASVARLGGHRGSASASFTNDLVSISALKDDVVVYASSAHLIDIALWIAVPPLVLWLFWLALRPKRDAAPAQQFSALPDAARNGFAVPATPNGTPIERREQRG